MEDSRPAIGQVREKKLRASEACYTYLYNLVQCFVWCEVINLVAIFLCNRHTYP